MNSILTGGQVSPKATPVLSAGTPPLELVTPTLYYDMPPPNIPSMPSLSNVFLLNQLALQQQQQQVVQAHAAHAQAVQAQAVQAQTQASLGKPSPKAVYTMPPPGYGQWPGQEEAVAAAAAAAAASTATAGPSTPTSSANDNLSILSMAKNKQAESDVALLQSQAEMYSAYPGYHQHPLYFMPQPRLFPQAMFPRPLLIPQMQHPLGLLGVKRSWEQAFPVDGNAAAVSATKRWAPVAGFGAQPGFYPEV